MKFLKKYNNGFTLVELLVVISIISFLSSIILANLQTAREKGRISAGQELSTQMYHALLPIGIYTFDDATAGIAKDSASINGNNGSFIGGLSYDTQTPSNVGKSLAFNGTSGYVLLPAGILKDATSFSFSAWVYWRGPSTESWQRIFDFGNDTSVNMFLTTRSNHSANMGGLRYAIKNGGGEIMISSSKSFAVNKWQHVAVTHDGKTGKASIYLDGALLVEQSGVTIKPSDLGGGSTVNNYIGKSQWGDPLFDGYLDDVRIYSQALTLSQVEKIYAEGTAKKLAQNNNPSVFQASF